MNEEEARHIIFTKLNEHRKKVRDAWFLSSKVKDYFLSATEEYWMIGSAFNVVYGNGLPHDIKNSEGQELRLYENYKKEILSFEGMPEYLEKERIRVTNENLIRNSMRELIG